MREAYWELRQPGGTGPRSRVVLGRKHCARCGHWRHIVDFRRYKNGTYLPRCRVCEARYKRELRAGYTPEQRERDNEYRRIWDDAKRRKQGIPPRNFRNRRSVIDTVERVGLPFDPLHEVIKQVGLSDMQLAAIAKVSTRSIYRLRVGESRHVRLDTADKLAHGLGIPLEILYEGIPAVRLDEKAA